jgi:hypothetical protein
VAQVYSLEWLAWRVFVAGCLMACALSSRADEQPPPKSDAALLVVLIGGFDSDPTPEQLAGTARRGVGNSGMFQLRNDLRARQIAAEYFNWNGTPAGEINRPEPPGAVAIVDHIQLHLTRTPRCRIAVVGNSWGGHTTWEVCDTLSRATPPVPIERVIFLDPSSAGRPMSQRPETLPANVASAVQYASRSAVVWRAWPVDPRIEDIDLANAKHGFLRPNGPPYGSLFAPNAHIGAEWDDRIHADIVRRLLGKSALDK